MSGTISSEPRRVRHDVRDTLLVALFTLGASGVGALVLVSISAWAKAAG